MKHEEITNGMKVEIVSNKHGGHFSIGSIGVVLDKNRSNFKVQQNNTYWWYEAEDVRRPIKAKSARPARPKRPLNKLHGKMPISCDRCPIVLVCDKISSKSKASYCKLTWRRLARYFAM